MAKADELAATIQAAKQAFETLDLALPAYPADPAPKRWRIGQNGNLEIFDSTGVTAVTEFSIAEVQAALPFLVAHYGDKATAVALEEAVAEAKAGP